MALTREQSAPSRPPTHRTLLGRRRSRPSSNPTLPRKRPRPPHRHLGFPPFRGGLPIADGASHSPVPRCHRLVPRAAEAERPVSRGPALSGSLGGSLVEHLLVGVLREFACWLAANAPEVACVADLRRHHIEAYK